MSELVQVDQPHQLVREHPLGVFPDLDIDAYHQGDGISKTGLDAIARSPAYFFGQYRHPQRPPFRRKAGQLEGSLAHCAALEPEHFDRRYVVIPDDAPNRPSSRQREAKKPSVETLNAIAWWDDFLVQHNGKEVITAAQREAALRQGDNIRALPEVRDAMLNGAAELSAYWRDEKTGLLCRCRPDWTYRCGTRQCVLLDVKTFNDCRAAEFRRQVQRKRYDCQDAYYSDGFQIASGMEVLAFVFIVVETEWPYLADVLMLDDASKAEGRALYRRDLDTYAECLRTDTWPMPAQGIQVINTTRKWSSTREEAH